MVIIRNADLRDAEACRQIFDHYLKTTAVHFSASAPPQDEYVRHMQQVMERYPWFAAEEDGAVKGFAYAGPFLDRPPYAWSCEITIYVAPDAVGTGIGRMLFEKLEESLRRMGIVNLYAYIAVPDGEDEYLTMNSADFHAHMGFRKNADFQRCGRKFGRWYSVIWMEKQIGEQLEDQPPVIYYPDLES